MFNVAVFVHFYNVETGVGLFPILPAIAKRDLIIAPLLFLSHRFAGRAKAFTRTRFHFDKHDFIAILHNQIRFSKGRAEIAL